MNEDVIAVSERVKAFLVTPLGKQFMLVLHTEYNDLHQAAEAATTMEQKALNVERAAGVKFAIGWLLEREGYKDLAEQTRKAKPQS